MRSKKHGKTVPERTPTQRRCLRILEPFHVFILTNFNLPSPPSGLFRVLSSFNFMLIACFFYLPGNVIIQCNRNERQARCIDYGCEQVCPQERGGPLIPGCYCIEGYYRNRNGYCVTLQQCAPPQIPQYQMKGQQNVMPFQYPVPRVPTKSQTVIYSSKSAKVLFSPWIANGQQYPGPTKRQWNQFQYQGQAYPYPTKVQPPPRYPPKGPVYGFRNKRQADSGGVTVVD